MLQLGADANSAWQALNAWAWPSSYIAQVRCHITRIMKSAKIAFDLFGSDGAYSNLKLAAGVAAVRHAAINRDHSCKTPVTGSILCGNHRNGLIEGSVVGMAGPNLVANSYCCSNFLRMGGHFARLRLASDNHSALVVVRPRSAPPVYAKRFNDQLCNLRLRGMRS